MTVRNVIILKSWKQEQLARPRRNLLFSIPLVLNTLTGNETGSLTFTFTKMYAFRQIGLEARATQVKDQPNSPGSQNNQEKGQLNRSGSPNNKLNKC